MDGRGAQQGGCVDVSLGPWEDDLDPSNAQGSAAQATEACLLLCAEGVICQHTEPCHLRDGQGSFQGSGPLDREIMQRKGGTVRVPQTWA